MADVLRQRQAEGIAAAKALNVAPSTFLRWTHDDHVEKCLKKSA